LKKIGVDNPHAYQSLTDAYTALEAGQIDAVLIDTAINLGEAARSNGKFHVFLYAGQIEEEGPPDRIFSEPSSDRTRQFLRSIIEAKRM
jgi:ABC-type histidine transport system ATPase subunit